MCDRRGKPTSSGCFKCLILGSDKSHYGLFCYVITTLVFVADQATKILIEQNLRMGESIPVVQTLDFFRITYISNTGAAWGFLQGYYPLFIGAALIVSVICIWIIETAPERWIRLTAALILGGGLGNMIDRIFLNTGVVDFLDVGVYSYRWPAFNVADMMLVTGVVFFVIYLLLDDGLEEEFKFLKGAFQGNDG